MPSKYFKSTETPASGHVYVDAIPEADVAFDTAAGHDHDGTDSKLISAGGQAFPVGSVFLAVVATDPATLLGYGTWTQIA